MSLVVNDNTPIVVAYDRSELTCRAIAAYRPHMLA